MCFICPQPIPNGPGYMYPILENTPWETARQSPIAGDLSARRYIRLENAHGESSVLMNAQDVPDSVAPFVSLTNWLLNAGLSAPKILISGRNTLLLEDFGDIKVSDLEGEDREIAYSIAIDILLHIRAKTPPSLPQPDAVQLAGLTHMATQYPGADADKILAFSSYLETMLALLLQIPATMSLRDFHADNLMWLPDRNGLLRLGLLDYQDAFLTHPVYDLVSLLTDARTDIPPDFQNDMIKTYADRSGDDLEQLTRAFAIFSAQRNLRILGVFSRAANLGKPHHLPKLPRVHRHFSAALKHSVFDPVRDEALAAVPKPGGGAS